MGRRRSPFLASPFGQDVTLELFTEGAKTTAVWSVINLQDLMDRWRFDAEYWQPQFIENELTIDNVSRVFPVKTLFEVVDQVTGSAFYPAITDYYSRTKGIPFIRVSDLGRFFVTDQDIIRLPKWLVDDISQISVIEEGDMVIAKGGSIGGVCLVPKTMGKSAVSRDVIAIKTNPSLINSLYLIAYLQSKFGQLQLERYKSLQVQAHLTFPAVGNIRIVELPTVSQNIIADNFNNALGFVSNSGKLYRQAESLLLNELGIESVELLHHTAYQATFSDIIGSKRLDAEFFQPKYQILLSHIQATNQWDILENLVKEPIRRGIQPDYDEEGEITVINSKHVGKTHVDLSNNRFTTTQFLNSKNYRGVVKQYDVLLNSTGVNTIGRCQVLLDETNAMVDGHISIIRPDNRVDPVYLALFLNVVTGQMQTERHWTGSSGQIELRAEAINTYAVWIPDMGLQMEIRNLVERSNKARLEADRLLEEAINHVENTIIDLTDNNMS